MCPATTELRSAAAAKRSSTFTRVFSAQWTIGAMPRCLSQPNIQCAPACPRAPVPPNTNRFLHSPLFVQARCPINATNGGVNKTPALPFRSATAPSAATALPITRAVRPLAWAAFARRHRARRRLQWGRPRRPHSTAPTTPMRRHAIRPASPQSAVCRCCSLASWWGPPRFAAAFCCWSLLWRESCADARAASRIRGTTTANWLHDWTAPR